MELAERDRGDHRDREDMARYQAGERPAFEALFRRHATAVHAYFARTLGDSAAADDLTQQTFLRVHRARKDFDPKRAFRPWLFAIAANLRRDHLRSRQRKPEVPIDSAPEPSVAATVLSPSERLVRRCVGALPEHERDVIVLHWFEEFRLAEVAESLGISLSAAKVRAHRAYGSLRTCMGQTL